MNRRTVLRSSAALVAGCTSGAIAAGVVAVASPSSAAAEPVGAELSVAIERCRSALAVERAALEARRPFAWAEFDQAGSSADAKAAFESADEGFQAAVELTIDAIDDIVAVPIHTLADMRAKAVFLSAAMPPRCLEYDDTLAALLASMGGAAEGLNLTHEPDPFLVLYERDRRHQEAYRAAPDSEDPDSVTFFEANDGAAGLALCNDPPRITSTAGLRAAIACVADDGGYVQAAHARILRQALAYLDGRA